VEILRQSGATLQSGGFRKAWSNHQFEDSPLPRLSVKDGGSINVPLASDDVPSRSMRLPDSLPKRIPQLESNRGRTSQPRKREVEMNWYLVALKKYAVFAGRARRKEFWFFMLFNTLITVALAMIDMWTGTYDEDVGLGLLSGLYAVAMIVPSIAVTVRRLHDTDRSGWWYLLLFIPLIGALVILVFMLLDSQRGSNRFGPNPKEEPGPGVVAPM